MSESDDDKVVDLKAARERLAPIRKEKAAKDLRKQFQKAMGWKSVPKTKKPGGSKGSTGDGPDKGPKGGRRKKI